MMLKNLGIALVGALCISGVVVVGARAISRLEKHAIADSKAAAELAAQRLDAELRSGAAAAAARAQELAREAGLVAELAGAALERGGGSGTAAPERLLPSLKGGRARLSRNGALSGRLVEKITNSAAYHTDIAWFVVLDSQGAVLASQWPVLSEGQSALGAKTTVAKQVAGATSLGGSEGALAPPLEVASVAAVAQRALQGALGQGALVAAGKLFFVGAAPAMARQDEKILGSVIVARHAPPLLRPRGMAAFVVGDGKVVLGTRRPPAELAPPVTRRADGEAFFLLGPRTPGLVAKIDPAWLAEAVDLSSSGLWGRRFAVPGSDRLMGILTVDLSRLFTRTLWARLQLAGAGVAAWLVWVMVLFWVNARDGRASTRKEVWQPGRGSAVAAQMPAASPPGVDTSLAAEPTNTLVFGPAGAEPRRRDGKATGVVLGDLLDGADGVTGGTTSPEGAAMASGGASGAAPAGAPEVMEPQYSSASADFLKKIRAKNSPKGGDAAASAPVAPPGNTTAITSITLAPEDPSSPGAPNAAGATSPEDELKYRGTYDEFMATRRQCNEAGELTFEKFLMRLKQSRAAVIAKHNCTDVRFQVYVKNGKAALKASPV